MTAHSSAGAEPVTVGGQRGGPEACVWLRLCSVWGGGWGCAHRGFRQTSVRAGAVHITARARGHGQWHASHPLLRPCPRRAPGRWAAGHGMCRPGRGEYRVAAYLGGTVHGHGCRPQPCSLSTAASLSVLLPTGTWRPAPGVAGASGKAARASSCGLGLRGSWDPVTPQLVLSSAKGQQGERWGPGLHPHTCHCPDHAPPPPPRLPAQPA